MICLAGRFIRRHPPHRVLFQVCHDVLRLGPFVPFRVQFAVPAGSSAVISPQDSACRQSAAISGPNRWADAAGAQLFRCRAVPMLSTSRRPLARAPVGIV